MSDENIVILDGARTPMAEYNGALADVTAIDLGAHAAREAMSRSGVSPSAIDHVIFGNALQTSGDAIYGARHVGLKAGVPKEVPAVTVNRLTFERECTMRVINTVFNLLGLGSLDTATAL